MANAPRRHSVAWPSMSEREFGSARMIRRGGNRFAGRSCAGSKAAACKHDPEKWEPVFGQDHALPL